MRDTKMLVSALVSSLPPPFDTNMPLTATAVTNARAADKPIKMSDGGGLYLLVQPNGSRLWRMNYRWLGKQKTLALGAYPAVKLVDARRERDAAKETLARGVDPAKAKVDARVAAKLAEAETFQAIGEEWLAQREKEDVTESTKFKDRRILQIHAFPAFGRKPIRDVRVTDLLQIIRKMEGRDQREVTRKFRSVVGRVFTYAILTERAERNPAADLNGLLLPQAPQHHSALLKPLKVGQLMLAVRGYDGLPSVRLGLRFLAHTFVRTIEMRSADWSWVDWKTNTMEVPAGFMKKRRPHIVPLSAQVVDILKEMRATGAREGLIFPGVRASRTKMSENTINGALRRLGYSGDEHTGHGFRRTASTTLNESGRFHVDWIELQLAHVDSNKVRGAYNAAQHLEARREMMQWYSDWLDQQEAVASLM